MDNIADSINFVKQHIDRYTALLERFSNDEQRVTRYSEQIRQFKALRQTLEEMQRKSKRENGIASHLHLQPEDLEGLPPELIEELSITETDRLEYDIVNLIKQRNGVASLDHLLIGFYNLTQKVATRQELNSRLYRMSKKRLIHSVPGRKGVYSIKSLTRAQGKELA